MTEQPPPKPAAARRVLTYRHSVVTRISHWINALCLTVLLLSGLQILNAYPSFHWGQIGADADPYLVRIETQGDGDAQQGILRIGKHVLNTTGFLGRTMEDGAPVARAFPSLMTLPAEQDLGKGRHWHFFFAWLFVANGVVYVLTTVLRGHLKRDLLPRLGELHPRHLSHEFLDHARLRFPKGEEARRYNALQKISYLVVIFILLPLMILTGLTMSPGFNAVAPLLLDLFGGRASARTIHFITASCLVAFVIVHVVLVVLSGPLNNMRSMITGRYAIKLEDEDR